MFFPVYSAWEETGKTFFPAGKMVFPVFSVAETIGKAVFPVGSVLQEGGKAAFPVCAASGRRLAGGGRTGAVAERTDAELDELFAAVPITRLHGGAQEGGDLAPLFEESLELVRHRLLLGFQGVPLRHEVERPRRHLLELQPVRLEVGVVGRVGLQPVAQAPPPFDRDTKTDRKSVV